MKPSWVRRNNDPFELRGCWARLWNNRHLGEFDQKMQVLFLRQLCRMTFWLAIIGVSSVILTCDIVTYR